MGEGEGEGEEVRGRIKGSKSERKLNKGREKDWKRERERVC